MNVLQVLQLIKTVSYLFTTDTAKKVIDDLRANNWKAVLVDVLNALAADKMVGSASRAKDDDVMTQFEEFEKELQ